MNATIRSIVECYAMIEVTRVTEEFGWDNVVTWCVEILGERDFERVKGGELVFLPKNYMKMTTGNVEKLMKLLKEHQVAGVVFTTEHLFSGDMLNTLSKNSRIYEIPVFSIEIDKDVFTLVKKINKEICYLENDVLMEESLLTDFLFKNRTKLLCAMTRLENCDINSMGAYEIAVVKVNTSRAENYPQYKYRLMKNELVNEYPKQVLSTVWEDMMIFAFETEEEDKVDAVVTSTLEYVYQKLFREEKEYQVNIALGRSCKPISAIRKSFDQALFTLDIFELLDGETDTVIRDYNQVGFYRILRNAHDPVVFRQFYNELLGELEEYDNQNNSELVETLHVYIDNNCSLVNTANAMYLHKNTLRYRLQRIKELTKQDLRDVRVISDFYLCFRIRKYMGVALSDN